MSLIDFPYTFHKGYLMPIIPITILDHRTWVFVDSGATFTILSIDDAHRIGIDWEKGRPQMIVVGDESSLYCFFISSNSTCSYFLTQKMQLEKCSCCETK